jgi:crotonobetainyl-CoA:carnitine CoA-transferase CaiB-like acyl-CoA transferase
VEDPRFSETENRLANRQELDIEIEKCLRNATTEEWLAVMKVEDIIAGPLYSVDETVKDPQVNHLNMMLDMEHPLGGNIQLAGNPVMMPSLNGSHQPPPTLGQHTKEVLKETLGYTDERTGEIEGSY